MDFHHIMMLIHRKFYDSYKLYYCRICLSIASIYFCGWLLLLCKVRECCLFGQFCLSWLFLLFGQVLAVFMLFWPFLYDMLKMHDHVIWYMICGAPDDRWLAREVLAGQICRSAGIWSCLPRIHLATKDLWKYNRRSLPRIHLATKDLWKYNRRSLPRI